MTQADDKKSVPSPLLSDNSPVQVMEGLADEQTARESATGSAPTETALFPIVGIGASAGGVDALQRLFKSLPSEKNIAYIVVLHLAPDRPSHLADILAKTTPLAVVQVSENTPVEPGKIYVIPPGHYLLLERDRLRLEEITQPRPLRKAVDVLFTSLAEEQQERAIGIVLTGADHDGTVGLRAIKSAGGMVMAQTPETAQHPGMPESAVSTGLMDYVLPIEEMAQALVRYIDCSGFWGRKGPGEGSRASSEDETHILENIVSLLREHGADFRGYKDAMLMRRAKRRMALRGLENLGSYLDCLQQSPEEIRNLKNDLLIGVTEFFREPQAWHALEEVVLPQIIHDHAQGEPIRAWVAGGATGEEAYSLGITLLELLRQGGLDIPIKIIASDLDPPALEAARAGVYPETIANTVSPELLTRYFTRLEGNQFKVRKALRDSVLFSQHNLIADPPFSRIDLISCRNLLIYLKPEVQDRLLRMFHFALQPRGYLFLGKSETVAAYNELFKPVSKQFRLYQAAQTPRKQPVRLPLIQGTSTTRMEVGARHTQRRPAGYAELVRELLLQQRSAAAVLIDRDSQLLYFYGPTRDFLIQSEGAATRDLLSMVSDSMRIALRTIIHSARAGEGSSEAVLERPDENRQLHIRAVRADREDNGLLMVTFEYEPLSAAGNQPSSDSEARNRRQLQEDLLASQRDLEATIQALEASNEELHIANEEAMSMNEELQSANEELETSKEELATVNSDLDRTIAELRTANEDLLNLLASNDLPTLFLDSGLRIKRFTPASHRLFRLIDSDIGRPISDFALRIEPGDLEAAAREAQASGSAVETEVHTPEGNFYLRRILPYRTVENNIEGAVITFIPIDALKQAEYEVRESKKFRELADTAPVFIWISGVNGKLEFVNRRFVNETGRTAESLLGTGWYDLVHPDDLVNYLAACSNAETTLGGYDQELRLRKDDGAYSWMRFVGVPRFERGHLVGFVGSSVDIQYHKNAEEQLRTIDRRKDEFLAILGHELRNPLSPIRNAAEALRFVRSEDKRLTWARETITRQVDHMTRLVEDLLDVARFTRGILTLRKETVDMTVVIGHAVESTRVLMEARRHHFTITMLDEPLMVNGDAVRLTQIIENLLTNAAKFTNDGGKISVSARLEGSEVVVSVEDNGIGIPRRILPKIFELFMQEERAFGKSSSGLGIGLALVSQLVSLHGGTIVATSDGPGQGSKFVLRLPSINTRSARASVAKQVPGAGTGRVLVVDDNVDSADAIAMLLGLYGYEVRKAYDSATAISEASSFAPHVALLDLSRPEPDGLRIAGRFQQMEETKKTVLIAVSGYGQPDDLERTRKAGFAHHLVKPVEPEMIHKLIKTIISDEVEEQAAS